MMRKIKMSWISKLFKNAESGKTGGSLQPNDWRKEITRPTLALTVGGCRPTGEFTKSCFAEVRAGILGDPWPVYNNRPLWPLCQLNLLDACFRPKALSDVALITVFIAEDYIGAPFDVIDGSEPNPNSSWFLRAYKTLDGLQPINAPENPMPRKCEPFAPI